MISVFESLRYTGGWKWLVDIIGGIIKVGSSMGLGIILFTFILKLITLPLDVWSRISMRKNSLKMEEMRPQLEKLQKQYADNKQLYNQKMTALYKKNGYSMLGGCLPTIVTLVFFFIVLTGFNKYSIYQNTEYYSDMRLAYSKVVYDNFIDEDLTLTVRETENKNIISKTKKDLFIDNDFILKKIGTPVKGTTYYYVLNSDKTDIVSSDENNYDFSVKYDKDAEGMETCLYYAKGLLNCKVEVEQKDGNYIGNSKVFLTNKTAIEKDEGFKELVKAVEVDKTIKLKGDDYNEYYSVIADQKDILNKYSYYIKSIARSESAKTFKKENQGFLWVNNIWASDSPLEKTVFSSASKLKSKAQVSMTEGDYNEITHDLAKEKNQPNGYFIMVVLVIGTSLLSQWIMTKSQKAQLELQSVDGKGAKQQKIMMIIMPIMMAIFAFMYTTAFSIYIVFSSLFSTASTLIINYLVDLSFKKKKKEEIRSGDKRVIGKTIIEEDKEKKE